MVDDGGRRNWKGERLLTKTIGHGTEYSFYGTKFLESDLLSAFHLIRGKSTFFHKESSVYLLQNHYVFLHNISQGWDYQVKNMMSTWV